MVFNTGASDKIKNWLKCNSFVFPFIVIINSQIALLGFTKLFRKWNSHKYLNDEY